MSGDVWGLDGMEKLYVTVNVGRLVLHPGASVGVRGNVLSPLCQQYVCLAEPDADSYQVGILPTLFLVDYGSGPHDGPAGPAGRAGANGADAPALDVVVHWLGNTLRGPDPTDAGQARRAPPVRRAPLALTAVTGYVQAR